MKKAWHAILGSILVTVGGYLVLNYPLLVPILTGIFLSNLGITLLLDQLRGRLVKPAPDYRYRAQELGIIFRGPPR
jgi:hypothetical protein